MKVALYSITYLGIWYDGPALDFEAFVKRARSFGYAGVELDGKRPHGNPMDLDARARDHMRNILAREGMEIAAVAANNDFSSPIPEHRESQLLFVRELTRLAADLGAPVVRLFAAWPGVPLHEGKGTYDLIGGNYYSYERQYPYATRIQRWNHVRACLKEAARFGEEFGVVMALQNHGPLIRHWRDCYDLVREVDSPWLKVCLDLPIMTRFDHEWVTNAALTIGDLQAYTHYGWEFQRDEDGQAQLRWLKFGQPLPDYPHFVDLMRQIGYDGYWSFELCHPFLNDSHEMLGIEAVDEQAELACEYMTRILREAGTLSGASSATAGAPA